MIRDVGREELGIDLSESIPNCSQEEKEKLQQLGHDFLTYHQQGSRWETPKYESLAEIIDIAARKKDAESLEEAFRGLPHLDKQHLIEGLREYLMDRE